MPQANADGAAGRVVFAAAKGEQLDKAAVEQAVKRLGGVEDVASASDPFQTGAVSKDGRIAYTDLQFSVPEMEVGAAQTDAIEAAAADAAAAGRVRRLGRARSRASRRSARCSACSSRCSCSPSRSARCWPPACRC